MALVRSKDSLSLMVFFNLFIVRLLFLQGLVYVIHQNDVFARGIQSGLAKLVATFYNLLDTEVASVIGNRVVLLGSNTGVTIDNECTGLMLMATVLAACLALLTQTKLTTASVKKRSNRSILIYKLILLIFVVIVLLVENIIRMSHLLYIVKIDVDSFEFFHLYIWQIINFITGLMVTYTMLCFINKANVNEQ